MSSIHGQLMQWTECQQGLASSGISLARPVPVGREAVLTFWQEISQIRLMLQSQCRPQVQQQQPLKLQRLQQLRPQIVEGPHQISGTPTRLKFPGFAETPLPTMMLSAVEA